ncbi:MerR family transcriptional regulator [Actinospongicola halichondriae]|uniref:MerR family transcriptional regulator n=1 Tax=Actinospongicola halichondriae TaxID=3236844 RepID=UPI003D3C5745
MPERAHLSIGEVLSLVQEDFPDVTISKIRFLESQGLLDPERTPSGYRKFYDADIERLQWILLQQRDNFLPLKVIRDRLDEWDATGNHPEGSRQTPAVADLPSSGLPATSPSPRSPTSSTRSEPADDTDPVAADDDVDVAEPDDARAAAATLAAASAMEVIAPEPPAARAPVVEPEPESPPAPRASAPDEELRVGPTSTSLTAEELAAQSDVPVSVIHELESFTMIESRRIGADSYFEPSARSVVDACRSFLEHGIEVRHLRMYKIAAEREAGVFEQLVMPLLKQRNPEARARAVDTVTELADAGEALHASLLRKALSDTLP